MGLLFIAILLIEVATTQTAFLSTPTSVNAKLGSNATFRCSATTGVVAWIVNGSLLTELNQPGISASQVRSMFFLTVPATEKYNNTVVVCALLLLVGNDLYSDPVVLKIQGVLAAVGNLMVYSQLSSILVNWTPPFSLDITGVDRDLWYCVEVYNITRGRTLFTNTCDVYDPEFNFSIPNRSPCEIFEFKVFAVNQVGKNASYIDTKQIPVVDDIEVEFLSPMDIKVQILFLRSLDICNGEVFAGDTFLTRREGIGIFSLPFNVTNGTLEFNHNYTITLQVDGHKSYLGKLSTFDVERALGNNCSFSGVVNVTCTFASNSQALGCLVILHLENKTEIFAYATRYDSSAPTSDISIHGVPKGIHMMLVFDGEYNGLLSEQAAISPQNITVTDGNLESVKEDPGTSINTTGDQICVSCPDDGVSKGCVVVLRPPQEMLSLLSYEIPKSEEGRCFPKLQSGEYTVAVFKQNMSNTLQKNPVKVAVVSVSIPTETTSIPPNGTSPTIPNRDSKICAPGCFAGTVVAIILVIMVIVGAVAIIVFCCRKHQLYKDTHDVLDAPETLWTVQSQVPWNGEPSMNVRYTELESVQLVTDGVAESPQITDFPPPTYGSVVQHEGEHALSSPHGTADETNQSQGTNQQLGVHYAEVETVLDHMKVKPPSQDNRVLYSDILPPKRLPEEATFLSEEITPLQLPNQIHHDTPLNLESVTPKNGADQYFDIHPRKTLPADAMFEEEPNPPPLPTKTCHVRPLTLETLFTKLHPTVTDQWKKLGELLKIDEDLLDEIFTNNETNEECLKAVLEVWLQKSTNLTWKDVTHALKELEKNENNHCASCDCDVEDATEEEGDESEPPVSDEAVSRKPYPHQPQHSSGVSHPQESQLLLVGFLPREFGDLAEECSPHDKVPVTQELIKGSAAQCSAETTDIKGADVFVNGNVCYDKEHVNLWTHVPSGRHTYSTQLPVYGAPDADGNLNCFPNENLALQKRGTHKLHVEDAIHVNAADQGAGNAANEGAGNAADQGAGNAADEGAGNAADQGAGNAADQGAGNAANEGAGNAADQGAGNAADQGAGNAADQVKLLKVMNNDLHKLADDWSNLGVHLEVPLAKQQLTKHGYQQIDECRKELLLTWSNRETFTWMEVVQGLVDNVKTLGCWIAHKYGSSLSIWPAKLPPWQQSSLKPDVPWVPLMSPKGARTTPLKTVPDMKHSSMEDKIPDDSFADSESGHMTGSSQPSQVNSGNIFAALHTAMNPNRAQIWQQLVTKLMMVQSNNHIDEILDSNGRNEECLEDVPEELLKTSLKHALQNITENKLADIPCPALTPSEGVGTTPLEATPPTKHPALENKLPDEKESSLTDSEIELIPGMWEAPTKSPISEPPQDEADIPCPPLTPSEGVGTTPLEVTPPTKHPALENKLPDEKEGSLTDSEIELIPGMWEAPTKSPISEPPQDEADIPCPPLTPSEGVGTTPLEVTPPTKHPALENKLPDEKEGSLTDSEIGVVPGKVEAPTNLPSSESTPPAQDETDIPCASLMLALVPVSDIEHLPLEDKLTDANPPTDSENGVVPGKVEAPTNLHSSESTPPAQDEGVVPGNVQAPTNLPSSETTPPAQDETDTPCASLMLALVPVSHIKHLPLEDKLTDANEYSPNSKNGVYPRRMEPPPKSHSFKSTPPTQDKDYIPHASSRPPEEVWTTYLETGLDIKHPLLENKLTDDSSENGVHPRKMEAPPESPSFGSTPAGQDEEETVKPMSSDPDVKDGKKGKVIIKDPEIAK